MIDELRVEEVELGFEYWLADMSAVGGAILDLVGVMKRIGVEVQGVQPVLKARKY